jgi:hypothetical protein
MVYDVWDNAKHCSTLQRNLSSGEYAGAQPRTFSLSNWYEQLRAEANVIFLFHLSNVHLTMRGLSGRMCVGE